MPAIKDTEYYYYDTETCQFWTEKKQTFHEVSLIEQKTKYEANHTEVSWTNFIIKLPCKFLTIIWCGLKQNRKAVPQVILQVRWWLTTNQLRNNSTTIGDHHQVTKICTNLDEATKIKHQSSCTLHSTA